MKDAQNQQEPTKYVQAVIHYVKKANIDQVYN